MLIRHSAAQLTALFERLPLDHPARGPYRLFSQASDTVRSGIVLGLGTRLQVLQNEAVARILRRSDIDLTAPGKRKCATFVVLSDQDATMAFLSSLFFSFLFIKLTRFADSTPEMRCPVPVNLILDEFNNIGKLGGAADGSDFARTLSVVRSRAIYVTLAVQSLGQLQNRYPNNLWAEIVGNCDVQIMLGCTDDLTAEYFSSRSGDMSIQVSSTMTVRQTMALAQVIPQYRQTQGQESAGSLPQTRCCAFPIRNCWWSSGPQPAEAGEGGLHRAAPVQGDRPQQRAGVHTGTASRGTAGGGRPSLRLPKAHQENRGGRHVYTVFPSRRKNFNHER